MSSGDSMLDVYLYENDQLLEKFESILLICESENAFTEEQIAEIFRILHTIKGSSAMMSFEGVANLSHALEDLFDHMRAHLTSADDYPGISRLALRRLISSVPRLKKYAQEACRTATYPLRLSASGIILVCCSAMGRRPRRPRYPGQFASLKHPKLQMYSPKRLPGLTVLRLRCSFKPNPRWRTSARSAS